MPSGTPVSSIPSQQTAIVATGPGKLAIIHNAPVPALAPDMVLVKTTAVAINPADAKFLVYSPSPGAIHGADFAGTVVALGTDATAQSTLKIGDRVAGAVHGADIGEGGIKEAYILLQQVCLLDVGGAMMYTIGMIDILRDNSIVQDVLGNVSGGSK
ncbi:MAG: hypothetical protein Q9186_004173 [Xanthomendoza sp. 1 TL-2023]